VGRTEVLNNFGLKVSRFTNDEILYNIDSVIDKIQREITERIPPKREQGGKSYAFTPYIVSPDNLGKINKLNYL
jgi:hypothetical protein